MFTHNKCKLFQTIQFSLSKGWFVVLFYDLSTFGGSFKVTFLSMMKWYILQIHLLKLNLCFIARSRLPKALFFAHSYETKFVFFSPDSTISSSNSQSLKLVDLFLYLSSNISSTESSINICIGKALTAIYRLMVIWKSDLSDETWILQSCCHMCATIWLHHLDFTRNA